MNPPPQTNTFGSALGALRRRWKIVVAVTVIVVAVTAYHQASKSTQYKATSNVTFDSSSLSQSLLAAGAVTTDPTVDGPTDVLVATSLEVARLVKAQLHIKAPASDLTGAVSAQVAPNAAVLQITATAGTAKQAAQLSNAFATQYINYQTNSQIDAITAAQAKLQAQLNALPATSPERATLTNTIQRLGTLEAAAAAGSQLISPATPPGKPAGTSTPIIILVALLIGLAISFLIVFLIESFDRHLSSSDAIEAEYRLPLLATIPEGRVGDTTAARADQLEPFRMLRTAIDLTSDRAVKTLLVTSAVAGEGKTTVAVDLAHAAALTGRRVVLVELDLRRPTFGRHFALDPRRGFTTVLAGGERLGDVLVAPIRTLPNLRVLPSGPPPPNPADLIESRATAEIIKQLADEGELVIIDSPPLNPVADAQVLLTTPVIDAAIVVARQGVATRDGVRRARRILDRHLLQPLGVVVNCTTDATSYEYGYGPEVEPTPVPAAADAERVQSIRRQTGTAAAAARQGRGGAETRNGRSGGEGQKDAPRRNPSRRADQRSRAERSKGQSRKPGN